MPAKNIVNSQFVACIHKDYLPFVEVASDIELAQFIRAQIFISQEKEVPALEGIAKALLDTHLALMERLKQYREKQANHGAKGGNPTLKGGLRVGKGSDKAALFPDTDTDISINKINTYTETDTETNNNGKEKIFPLLSAEDGNREQFVQKQPKQRKVGKTTQTSQNNPDGKSQTQNETLKNETKVLEEVNPSESDLLSLPLAHTPANISNSTDSYSADEEDIEQSKKLMEALCKVSLTLSEKMRDVKELGNAYHALIEYEGVDYLHVIRRFMAHQEDPKEKGWNSGKPYKTFNALIDWVKRDYERKVKNELRQQDGFL